MDLFGQSRSHLARDHALIEPGSFVTTPLAGWERTQGVILISPRMGARFTQYLATMEAGGSAQPAAAGIERCVYVLEGSLAGIKLYATDHGSRRTVAILADQYLRLAPYKGFIEALQAAGRDVALPPILPMPHLIERASVQVQPA